MLIYYVVWFLYHEALYIFFSIILENKYKHILTNFIKHFLFLSPEFSFILFYLLTIWNFDVVIIFALKCSRNEESTILEYNGYWLHCRDKDMPRDIIKRKKHNLCFSYLVFSGLIFESFASVFLNNCMQLCTRWVF